LQKLERYIARVDFLKKLHWAPGFMKNIFHFFINICVLKNDLYMGNLQKSGIALFLWWNGNRKFF